MERGNRQNGRFPRTALSEIDSLAFSPDGRFIAGGSYPGDRLNSGIQLWSGGSRITTLDWLSPASLAFSPIDSEVLAGGGRSGVRLWNVTTHRVIATLTDDPTNSVAFSPDGRTLASCGGNQGFPGRPGCGVRLWSAVTRRVTASLTDAPTASAAFSPDGKTLASCGGSGVRLWDLATRRVITRLTGDVTDSVAFSPDGRTLATGAEYGSLRLWDLTTGTATATLIRDASAKVAFSPDGRTLASTGGFAAGAEVHLWRM